eukprot:6371325-Prymnesium_polylepis.1
MWGAATAATSNELWHAADGSYVDTDTSGRYTDWAECKASNANAQFHWKCDNRGCNMNLAFSGSDDTGDWLQNAQAFPSPSDTRFHNGFYSYTTQIQDCVNSYRNMLRVWGIELDYIVGHSLGGAAATIYAQLHGNGMKGVATYGAPKTNYNHPTITGWRFMHYDDPVTSNLCFLACVMMPVNHVVSNAYEVYDKLECSGSYVSSRVQNKVKKCKKKWWKFWCWLEVAWTTVYTWVESCKWNKKIQSVGMRYAHNFHSLLWGLYGALQKHGAYGDYPSITL